MISYRDLGLLVLLLIGVGLGVYAFFIFSNLNAILKNIRDLQTRHSLELDKTLGMLPAIVTNLDEAMNSVKDSVGKASQTLDEVGATFSETVQTVTAGTEEAAEYIRVIADIVKAVISVFTKK